ncbi:hypothetical protein COLO4_05299 [Corchorus olitorius]|uniref:Uncharacterized protein n=1 Tax=Corchorus olitorius TaxID=93759 RepID=A0A1R3KR89_9ROSI|nr:hypothetical protein COLO4_05299 [Corchorus olitorius]
MEKVSFFFLSLVWRKVGGSARGKRKIGVESGVWLLFPCEDEIELRFLRERETMRMCSGCEMMRMVCVRTSIV